MKRWLFLICGLIMSSQAICATDWKEIRSGYYVDLSRFTANEVWVKQEFDPPEENQEKGKLVYSRLMKVKYSCNDQRIAVTQIYDYDSRGSIVESVKLNQVQQQYMNETIPGSLGEFTLDVACELQKQGFAEGSSSKNSQASAVSLDKQCDQILKDSYYFQAISRLCYGINNANLSNFVKSYSDNSCGTFTNEKASNVEKSVSQAIIKKGMQQGMQKFCENERSYYRKINMKYNGHSL